MVTKPKLTKPPQVLTHLITHRHQQDTATSTEQLMLMKPTCPCCSDSLLRHMRLGGIYWRCSSCHQEMPI